MNYSTSNGFWTRAVSWILLILFVALLFLLPQMIASLSLPEKAFVISFLAFLIVYSRVFGGTFFALNVLSMVERGEDIVGKVKREVTKNDLIKFLEEANLLFFVEGLVAEVNKVFSIYYDISLVFVVWLVLVYIGVPLPTAAAVSVGAAIAVLSLMLIGLFMNIYLNTRFVKVFAKEIEEFEELTKNLQLSDFESGEEQKEKTSNESEAENN